MRLLPAFAASLLLAGCGSSEKEQPPKSDTPPPRASAAALADIQRLEDARAPSENLVRFLEDADPAVRRRALVALGRIGDPRAIASIAPRLRDSDTKVAEDAVFALGLIADPAIAEPLRPILDSPEPEERALALKALGQLKRVGDLGFAAAKVADKSARVRMEVGGAVAWMSVNAKTDDEKSKVAEAVLALRPLLRDPDAAVRWRTCYALARLDPAPVAAELEAATVDQDPVVRAFATRALAKVKAAPAAAFIRSAGDADPRIAWEGVTALETRDGDDVVAALEKAASGGEACTIARAIEILGRKGKATPGTLKAASRHPSGTVRAAALEARARQEGAKALADIEKSLAAPMAAERRGAVAALVRMGGSEAHSELLKFFLRNERVLQLQALWTIADVAKESPARAKEWDDLLADALDVPDVAVRASVPDALGERKEADFDEKLFKAFRASSGTGMADAREAILAWFESVKRGREIANEGLKDAAFAVRKQAAATLEAIDGTKVAVDPEPAAKITTTPLEDVGYSTIVRIETDRGVIRIRLNPAAAPAHCSAFLRLVKSGYYDGKWWHRVVPNFVIQGGDPRGDGWGDVDFRLRDENSREYYDAGTVGMAKAGKDTGSSQLFITGVPTPHLEWNYTVFGRVESGLDVVRAIEVGDRILKATLE